MKYTLAAILVCILSVMHTRSFAQIGVDNDNPDPSSVLDLASTDKGVLIPRMTSAQRQAISSPANSLLVFDTDLGLYFSYISGQWHALNPWTTSGSNIHYGSGNVGVGVSSPQAKLDLDGTFSGGSGDHTNVTNTPLRLRSSGNYIRVPHISQSSTVSAVYNYETGKEVYWGEPTDAGSYFFRGRNLIVENGNMGVGTTTPGYKLDVNGPVNTTGLYINGTPFSVNGTIPAGGIIMWSGSIGSIPSGWALCDGSNGTPDLRNRFIVGAGSSYGVGNTGGQSSVTLTIPNLPSHQHSGTTNWDGSHSHIINGETMQKEGTATKQVKVLDTGTDPNHGNYTESTAFDGAHQHSFTTSPTGSGVAFDVRPPYYALAYIMKLP